VTDWEQRFVREDAMTGRADPDNKVLAGAVLRLDANVLGLVFGILGALIVFTTTNWLLIKGGSLIGPHLSLLSQFFIGYTVSFRGSLIGAAWAFVSGYVVGIIVAFVYNCVVWLKRG
jgi:hypothetical protein